MNDYRILKNFLLIIFVILFLNLVVSCKSNEKTKSRNEILKPKVNNSEYLNESELENYIIKSKEIKLKSTYQKPFDTLRFNKIIAYDFEGSEEPNPSVINQKNNFTSVILKQKYLNNVQSNKLIETLTDETTYGESTAGCFNPHLGFVFYNNNKVVYVVDVCLDCNYLISESEIPAMVKKKINIGTEDEYPAIGFSKIGKNKIRGISKELDFFYGRKEK